MCASSPLSPDSCRLLGITPQNPCLGAGTCSPPFTDLRCFDACLWGAVSVEGDGAAHFYTVTWLEHLSIRWDFCLSVFLGLMSLLLPENYYIPQIYTSLGEESLVDTMKSMGFTAEIVYLSPLFVHHHYFIALDYLYHFDVLVLGHLSFITICLQNPTHV